MNWLRMTVGYICVVNKKTETETLPKEVNALVYAGYVTSSRKMRFTLHCFDNEVTEIKVNTNYSY